MTQHDPACAEHHEAWAASCGAAVTDLHEHRTDLVDEPPQVDGREEAAAEADEARHAVQISLCSALCCAALGAQERKAHAGLGGVGDGMLRWIDGSWIGCKIASTATRNAQAYVRVQDAHTRDVLARSACWTFTATFTGASPRVYAVCTCASDAEAIGTGSKLLKIS